VIDDATERSRAEAALLESRARYRDLFGCITDAVIVTDLERQVVEVNPAFSRIFGYSMDEARGLHARSLYAEHGDFQKAGAMLARIRALDDEARQAGGAGGAPELPRTQVWRALCRHKSGRAFPVESSFSAMRSPAGQITGWVVVARDVTQRVWREDELRRSQQLLQAIVDGATAAIYVKDPGGRFLLVNERFAALVGRRAEEIVGQLDDDVYPPEMSERFRAGDRQAIALRSAVETEEEIVRDGAARTYLAVRFPLFDPDGEIFALGGTATDVTDRKRLEMQLRQAQKMEAIGQLAGGVAHDFNNLLTAILGYTQLLALALKSRPDLLPHVEEVRRAGERAAALTRQLLAFSRDQVLQPCIVHLDAAVADVLTLLRRLIGEQIELVTVLGAGPGRILVDPGQVEQLIVNLAVNARDAMPEGGRLVIETAEVELDSLYTHHHPEARPGPYVRLTMSDTGHGMDAETRSHIFEPFFTTKPQGKGTGLGLSTVYGVVLQSGGQIEVYSEPGRGSSFKVYFPRAAAEAGDPVLAAGAAGAALPSGSETVLLLEDEAPLRSLIRTVLESGGYTVLEEVGAEAALALARRHAGPIHLVLTDVVMPGMSGPDVAAQLATVRPEARILFMSGYSGSVMGHRNILPPRAQLLEKPFTAEGLLQRVREVLGGGVRSQEQEQPA
jgi:two-component system cell cycle sensor histidine kinase/response regulator CckA